MAKRSLLLVDGDSKSLRVLEVSLKKAGFNVITAGTGAEALHKAKNSQPDLVISDTDMEEMDGYDFCREFKKQPEWGEIPFIFLTGQTAIENKIRGLELGVDDYLTKPIYIKEILTRVRILLQKRDRANFEQKKDTNTRFAGRLSDMGVVDLIQTIEVSRKTGLIHFRAGEKRQATLFFKEGRVIDAEAGHLQGEDAVYRLLTWSEGEFEALFRSVRRKPLIKMSAQALLMEGMRRLDEWGRMQEQLPPLTQKFEVVYDELWDRLSELPDEVNQILKLFDARRSLEEVIDGANIGDLEAVEIISKLYFEGIIVEAGTAMGSGTFALEDLKIKREEPEIPPDLEDTIPETSAPTSEELGDETPAAADSDSGDLGAAAAMAVATAKSESKVKSRDAHHPITSGTTAELSGLLDKAIGEATPVAASKNATTPVEDSTTPVEDSTTSAGEEDGEEKETKRTTARGMQVAQISLKKRPTTVEEQLAENLSKSKSQPSSPDDSSADQASDFGSTQPLPGATQPPAETANRSEEIEAAIPSEDVQNDGDEDEVTARLAPSPAFAAEAESEDASEPSDDDEDASEPPDDDADAVPDATADSSSSGSIRFEADYADDEDDAAPNKPFAEDPDVAGVITSDRENSGIVSGSLASRTKSAPRRDSKSIVAADKESNRDQDERRPVPPISQHDRDEDDEDDEAEGGFSPWLPMGVIGAAAIVFLIVKSMGGDASEKPQGNQVATAVGDAGSSIVAPADSAPTPLPVPTMDAGSPTTTNPETFDAAVVAVVPDAAPKSPTLIPKPTVAPATDEETQLRTLLSSARKARRHGDKLEALQLIDEALEIRKSTTALLLKAETLLDLGDSKAAFKVATDLTTVGPRRAPAWRIRGLAAYEHKNYAEARKSFARYLELRPNASDADDVRALLNSL